MAENNSIFNQEVAPSPAEVAGESSEEEIKAARAKEASTEETTPVADEKSSDTEVVAPELSIVESTEESKVPASVPEAPKKKSNIQPEKEIVQGVPNDLLNSLSVDDIYKRLMESDEYYPTVDNIESMSDEELDQAYRYKLISEALTPDRFLFIWFLGGKKVPRRFKEQYMIKTKTFDKGYKHVLNRVRKSSNETGVHHSTLMKDFYEFLERDEAMYEAEKAKEEAARKKKAEAARAKAKEKKSKKTESKPSASAKAKSDKAAEKKPSTKKKASKAATEESVLSLFSMM